MLSFIGFLTVSFFIFVLIKALLNKKPSSQSVEYATETRRLATNELGVPSNYVNYLTNKQIDEIKNKALYLKNSNSIFKEVEWPRLMATSIYLFFAKDCESENLKKSNSVFNLLKIDPAIIEKVLNTDSYQLITLFVQAGKDYEFASDNEIKKLITEHAKLSENNISYAKLSKRIDRFVEAEECSIEYFGGYRGARFFIDIEDKWYYVLIIVLNPEKEEDSSISLRVTEYKN
ncbi:MULTISPECIES: hypothetical protein [Acinetobacter]|uniref:hypothetical protein n=1 Tax=Acinetobacter TaxID=469 RepID=UPI00051AFA71|nr:MULTISPECIES: hypothetical protein [Acinetobacter]MDH1859923.1 hypothetical protein [Acinetobacter junii]